MRTAIIAIVIVIFLGIFGPQTLFSVDETELAVVTQFGDIKAIHTTPGLKAKVPFVQSVNRFDKRVLRIDTPPARLNDSEKQILVIDAYTRYRITDVKLFFEKLRTPSEAETRIGQIVTSKLKEEVADRTRAEIIGGRKLKTEEGADVIVSTNSRQEMLDAVLVASNLEVGPKTKVVDKQTDEEKEVGEDFGIRIIDVRIKRADFSEDIRETTFTRMRAERERISRETRALGAEQDARIRAEVDKQKAIILADANRQADLTRGEGEARAIEIFAGALEQDPEFYAFQRSLEAYKKFLSTNTTVVLSSDSELFQFLQGTEFSPVQKPKAIVGSIDSLSGNRWIVGGQEVSLNGATEVKVGSVPSVGLSIFVEGTIQEDGTIVASDVAEGIGGILEAISVVELVIDGQVVAVNEDTDIQIDPQKVSAVYLEGERSDDQLVATQITEGIRGTLQSTGDTTWTVGTTDITVNSNTQFIEEGADQPGAELMVSVKRKKDDSLVALKITLQQLPEAGAPAESAEQPVGAVEKLVGIVSSVTQRWKVTGSDQETHVVNIDDDSDIQLGANQIGLAVLIGFTRQADGSLLARNVRIS